MEQKCNLDDLNGIYSDIANLLGIECARKIFEEYRGQQITFPIDFFNKTYVYSSIVSDFNGSNIKQLAIKYEYSERTIRRILKEHKK